MKLYLSLAVGIILTLVRVVSFLGAAVAFLLAALWWRADVLYLVIGLLAVYTVSSVLMYELTWGRWAPPGLTEDEVS